MRTLRLLLLPILAAGFAAAQDDKAAVESAEREWNKCFVKHDKACLDKLTAPEFMMTMAMEGRPLNPANREQLMRLAENQAVSFQSLDEIKVMVRGDLAIATIRLRQIAEGGFRGDMTGTYLVTDIWLKTADGWKITARNAGRADKPSF